MPTCSYIAALDQESIAQRAKQRKRRRNTERESDDRLSFDPSAGPERAKYRQVFSKQTNVPAVSKKRAIVIMSDFYTMYETEERQRFETPSNISVWLLPKYQKTDVYLTNIHKTWRLISIVPRTSLNCSSGVTVWSIRTKSG